MKRLVGKVLMGVAAFMIVSIGAPALAGADGRHGEGMFQRLDLNKDGAIASSEVEAAQAERFRRFDTDGDGAVTEAEMLAAAQARIARRVAKRFARIDRNGDGRVEKAEFEEPGAARFARLDMNGDGLVSREEIRAVRQARRHGKQENGPPND